MATDILLRCRGIYVQGISQATVEIKTMVWFCFGLFLLPVYSAFITAVLFDSIPSSLFAYSARLDQ